MALLVYTILRSASSTAGHIRACSAVRFNRRFMLAICASLRTLLERAFARRGAAFAACAFGGSGFTVSTGCSELGGLVVSTAVGHAGSAVTVEENAPWLNVSQIGITLAVENVAGWTGTSSSDGNRHTTISTGDGVEDCADPASKLISRLG